MKFVILVIGNQYYLNYICKDTTGKPMLFDTNDDASKAANSLSETRPYTYEVKRLNRTTCAAMRKNPNARFIE